MNLQCRAVSRADRIDKIEPESDTSDSFGQLMMKRLALDFEYHLPYRRFYGRLFPICISTETNSQF